MFLFDSMNKFDLESYDGLIKGIVKCAGIVKRSADQGGGRKLMASWAGTRGRLTRWSSRAWDKGNLHTKKSLYRQGNTKKERLKVPSNCHNLGRFTLFRIIGF